MSMINPTATGSSGTGASRKQNAHRQMPKRARLAEPNNLQTNNAEILAASPQKAVELLVDRVYSLEKTVRGNNGEFYAAIIVLLDLTARMSGDERVAAALKLVNGIPGRPFPGCQATYETIEKVADFLDSGTLKAHWDELERKWEKAASTNPS